MVSSPFLEADTRKSNVVDAWHRELHNIADTSFEESSPAEGPVDSIETNYTATNKIGQLFLRPLACANSFCDPSIVPVPTKWLTVTGMWSAPPQTLKMKPWYIVRNRSCIAADKRTRSKVIA